MTTILVVEDDPELRVAVSRDLKHRGFTVVPVADVDQALAQVHAASFDVVLTDLRMGQKDGIDLLLELSDIAPNTRSILMSAYATASDHQRAVDVGAVQVLCKPFSSNQLMDAIRQAIECERGFRGSVHGLSLIDMLQMFHYARRSISINLGGRRKGEVHLRDGEVVHARRGALIGESALREVLAIPSGSVQTTPLAEVERTIHRDFQSLLLDVLRELDESERESSQDGFAFDGDWSEYPVSSVARPDSEERIEIACRRLVGNVDQGCACGVVALDSNELLGMFDSTQRPDRTVATLLIATAQLVRSPALDRLGRTLCPDHSQPVLAEGLRVASATHQHFVWSFGGGKHAVVLLTEADISPGLGWAQFKAAIPLVERCLS